MTEGYYAGLMILSMILDYMLIIELYCLDLIIFIVILFHTYKKRWVQKKYCKN